MKNLRSSASNWAQLGLLAAAMVGAFPAPSGAYPEADLALINGKILTVDAADSIAQAVAVKDGLIEKVGTDSEIQPLIGPQTEVLDLGGKTVTPGLIDSHTHLVYYGQVENDYVNLRPPEVTSIAQIVTKIAQSVAQAAPDEWIIGDGFFNLSEGRLPTRWDLDPVSPANPVFLNSIGGHFGTANSRALAIAGIDGNTPDPVGGVIDKDPQSGEPTGILWNHPAMDLVRAYFPPFSVQNLAADIEYAQEEYVARGLTGFQDVNTRALVRLRAYEASEPQLKLRGYLLFTVERPEDAAICLEQTELFRRPMLSYGGNKFLLDGQPPTSFTYEPHPGASYDLPTWDPDTLKSVVLELHRAGHQLAFHVMGDAAIDLALDAIEEALIDTPRPDHRHRLEHAMIPTLAALDRIKRLGVVVSAQPGAIYSGGDSYIAIWGAQRVQRLMPLRAFLDAGIALALGSDFPTVPQLAPQVALWEAVARRTSSGIVIAPQQSITVQEALRAHTIGSAYAAFEEDIKGSIEVGKLADMSVWSGDLYSVPTDEIKTLKIETVIVGGQIVEPQLPAPDLKANGSDGPLTLEPADPISLTAALDPRSRSGRNADWWLYADTPFGDYWFTLDAGWIPSSSPVRVYGGPLSYLPPYAVLVLPGGLPPGSYTFYFAVDDNMDGALNGDYFDSLSIAVSASD